MSKSVYYPRCDAWLSADFDDRNGEKSAPVWTKVAAISCTVNMNGYADADTCLGYLPNVAKTMALCASRRSEPARGLGPGKVARR